MVLKVGKERRKHVTKPRRSNLEERLWTYDEMLAELPETNQPTELWDGELIMAPAPTPRHQEVTLLLARLLSEFVLQRELGKIYIAPLDVVLTQRRVVQPDIIFISRENQSIIKDRIRGVPDLFVEVISPGSWRRDKIEKKALYEQHGVKEYWIVDLEAETIEIWGLKKGSYELVGRYGKDAQAHSRLLEGFEFAVEILLG